MSSLHGKQNLPLSSHSHQRVQIDRMLFQAEKKLIAILIMATLILATAMVTASDEMETLIIGKTYIILWNEKLHWSFLNDWFDNADTRVTLTTLAGSVEESKIFALQGFYVNNGRKLSSVSLIYAEEKENHKFGEIEICDVIFTKYDVFFFATRNGDGTYKAHYLDKGEMKDQTASFGVGDVVMVRSLLSLFY